MITTRFAPSPTGYLHLGGLRTALFSFLWARKNKGEFHLRIEDTDQKREVVGAKDHLIHVLNKLKLSVDGEIIIQSERAGRGVYAEQALQLIENKKAYYCFCTEQRLKELREDQEKRKLPPRYDRLCYLLSATEVAKNLKQKKSHVVRLLIPEDDVVVTDGVHGKLSFKSVDLNDVVLLKSDGLPTYHLANVVDDHDMKITHVIRGEEWIPSLPLHMILYRSFGFTEPAFYHVPLILNTDRSKLSKRQGHVSVDWYLQDGYLPEAILNYVAFLGWNPGDDREIFSLHELIEEFTIDRIHKAAAIFSIEKLNWYNAWYIKNWLAPKSSTEILHHIHHFLPGVSNERALKLFNLYFERLTKLSELTNYSKLLHNLPEYERALLVFKKSSPEKTREGLQVVFECLRTFEGEWTSISLDLKLKEIAEEKGLKPGDIFWPVRVALSGQEASPSPTQLLEYFGQEESLVRLKRAINKL